MKNFKKLFFVALVAAVAFFNSCKESGDVGYTILPATDTINLNYAEYNFSDGNDLFQITNEADSPIRTDSSYFSLVGSEISPVFGKTTASSFFSLTPITYDTTYYLDNNIESLDLVLSYHNLDSTLFFTKQRFYGSYKPNTVVQAFMLNPTSTEYSAAVPVNSDQPPSYNPIPLGQATLSADENQTQAIIHFDPSFRQQLGQILMRYNNARKYQDLWDHFPGIYLKSIGPVGAIQIFDVYHDTLKLVTRGRKGTDSKYLYGDLDSLHKFNYVFNSKCICANIFEHDYSNSKINFTSSPTVADSLYYLQAGAGLKTKITFKNISKKLNIKNKEVVYVNKARLRIKIDANKNSLSGVGFYSIPPLVKVYLDSIAPNGTQVTVPIPEFVSSSSGYFVNYMNSKGYYDIDLTQPIQNMINGSETQNSFYIVAAYSSFTAGRLILSKRNTVLEIMYTKKYNPNK